MPEAHDVGLLIRDVSVRFGGLLAVDQLSMRAPVGEITGLIGPERGRQDDDLQRLYRPGPADEWKRPAVRRRCHPRAAAGPRPARTGPDLPAHGALRLAVGARERRTGQGGRARRIAALAPLAVQPIERDGGTPRGPGRDGPVRNRRPRRAATRGPVHRPTTSGRTGPLHRRRVHRDAARRAQFRAGQGGDGPVRPHPAFAGRERRRRHPPRRTRHEPGARDLRLHPGARLRQADLRRDPQQVAGSEIVRAAYLGSEADLVSAGGGH